MSDTLFYILGLVTLPVGTLLVIHYAGWSLDRELRLNRRELEERERQAAV